MRQDASCILKTNDYVLAMWLAIFIVCLLTKYVSYSAQLRRISDNTLAIASGTVFNTILIWCANLSEVEISSIFCPVCLELQGHEVYTLSFNLICIQMWLRHCK